MQAPIRKVDQETEQAAGQQGSRGCERRKGSGNDRIEPDVAAAHFFQKGQAGSAADRPSINVKRIVIFITSLTSTHF